MGMDKKVLADMMKPLEKHEKYLKPPASLTTKAQKAKWLINNDFAFYSEQFLKIRNKKGKLVPFKLNDAQLIMERIDRYCRDNGILRRYIILKARQMGMSTYTEGKMFHATAMNELTNTMIITQEDKATQNLFNMAKLYFDELPPMLKPMRKKCNEKAIVFENPTNDIQEKYEKPGLRSKYSVATANVTEAGRSNTLTNLHASEVAFWAKADITMTGLMQAVADTEDSLVILESTANGVGGYFYDMWQQAINGENDFIPIFLPWFTDPGYTRPFESEQKKQDFIDMVNVVHSDSAGNSVHTYYYRLMEEYGVTYEQLNWYDYTKRNKCQNDDEKMFQEYPSSPEEAFISTGRPKFNMRALRKYKKGVTKPIRTGYLEGKGGTITFVDDIKGYISIWEEPKSGVDYCLGADVAEGLINGDYSSAHVGDNEFNVVASWRGHIDPDLYGLELIKLAKYYNNAYIGVENNNHGLTTLKTIQREEYWDIYYSKVYDRIADSITQKMGWTTSSRTKPMMIDKLAEFIRERYLGIWDEVTIGEMFTYMIEEKGTTNAQSGCYDDTVMSLAILLQLMLEGYGKSYVPEIPIDDKTHKRASFNSSGFLDPLFEKPSSDEEWSE